MTAEKIYESLHWYGDGIRVEPGEHNLRWLAAVTISRLPEESQDWLEDHPPHLDRRQWSGRRVHARLRDCGGPRVFAEQSTLACLREIREDEEARCMRDHGERRGRRLARGVHGPGRDDLHSSASRLRKEINLNVYRFFPEGVLPASDTRRKKPGKTCERR